MTFMKLGTIGTTILVLSGTFAPVVFAPPAAAESRQQRFEKLYRTCVNAQENKVINRISKKTCALRAEKIVNGHNAFSTSRFLVR